MHARESKLDITKAVRRILIMAFGVAVLLSLQITMVFAQTMGGSGQGRNSRPGELQRNPKPGRQTNAPQMNPTRPPAAASISGKIEKMEDALAQSQPTAAGDKQQAVDMARAANPSQGSGEQQKRSEPGAPSGSHLRLILRMTEGGGTEVLHATEVAGEAVISDEPAGTFVYEVTGSGQTLAVQAIPDPFEMRSFSGPPGSPTQGHHIERGRTATVVVDVPKMNLVSAVESNIAVKVYKIRPGALIDKINPAMLQKLKQENRLEIRVDLPASTLAPEIRQKGRKLGSQ